MKMFFWGDDGTFWFLCFIATRVFQVKKCLILFQNIVLSVTHQKYSSILGKNINLAKYKECLLLFIIFQHLMSLEPSGFIYQHPLPFLAFFGGSSTETRHKASLLQADPSWRSIDGPVGQNRAVCSKKWEMPWANWPPKS